MSLNFSVVDISACAPAGLTSPVSRVQAEQLASLLKAIADPARIQIISYLNASPGAEACACSLTEPLALSQPTVSHHLKVLADAGLVSREKRGTWAWYQVNQERWAEITTLFNLSETIATINA